MKAGGGYGSAVGHAVQAELDKRDASKAASSLYSRNEKQQTPLAVALVEKSEEEARRLLVEGAGQTIFVKGYAESSLVCTLPQARQPASSAFEHPDPFEGTSPELLQEMDAQLAQHVQSLVQLAVM